MTVAERINELERQQAAPQQPRPPYPTPHPHPHTHSHPHSHPQDIPPSHHHGPPRVTDHASLKAIQKKALLSFYERHHSAWKSEPQLSPPQPPPRPKPPPTSSVASRRSSSASDYATSARREHKLGQKSKEAPAGGEGDNLPVRHQHSSSCGSLTAAVSGPFIMGPAISIDDWVPERPPKNPQLRAVYDQRVTGARAASPDLPPPSPPPVAEDEVIVSDEPLPPPPPEDQLPLISYSRSQDLKNQYMNKQSVESSNSSTMSEPILRSYCSGNQKYFHERSRLEPQYENQPELLRCSKVRESCRASFMASRPKSRDLERHTEKKIRDDSQFSNSNKNRAVYQQQKSLESYFKNTSFKTENSISDDQIPVGPRINLDRKSIETLFPPKPELTLKNYEDIQPASLESQMTFLENQSRGLNKPGPQTPVDKTYSSSKLKAFEASAPANPARPLDSNAAFRQLQNQFIRSASVRRDLHSSQSADDKIISSKLSFQSSERKSLRYPPAQKCVVNSTLVTNSAQNGKLSPPTTLQQAAKSVTSASKLFYSRFNPDSLSNNSTVNESPLKQLPQSLPAQCPPTTLQQLSQSKASYLASYRREPREREREKGLPNFEGSYKRIISPSGGQIIHSEPMKEKSASQDSGLDDKQSYSEGSKSPSQENLASSTTISSCDTIETSKTLPRNYSLSLLSPTKRPVRTPRTQSDPIKATPREVIEEVTKPSEPKPADDEVFERLKPESECVSVTVSTATTTVSDEPVKEEIPERTVEEPLRLVQRTEVTLRVNAPTTDTGCQTDAVTLPLSLPSLSPAPSPPSLRHQLHEELECDQLSRDLASQLSPSDRLQGILVPGPEVKKSTDYVTGLFRLDLPPRSRSSVACTTQTTVSLPPSTPPAPTLNKEDEKPKESDRLSSDSIYFTTSGGKARLLLENQQSQLPGNTNLHLKKEELMSRLTRKLNVLRAEAVAVKEEGQVNETLGRGVGARVTALARPGEASKFLLHVKEVGHITSLLLGLSGRLARAENALITLPEDHADRKTLEGKRDKLQAQLEEAKELKRNIDRRSESVSVMLYKYLTAEEYADYDHFINMKAKLLVDSREIAEKIQLGEEQLAALRETLNEPR